MKTFYVYRLVNDEGQVLDENIVENRSDKLCIGGYGNDGKYHQFDSYESALPGPYFDSLNVGLKIVSTEVKINTDE
jgi:hypothetical protein